MKKHLLSATLILLSTLSYAQVPNSFSSGETISSSQINANFAYLANSIKNDEVTAMMVCNSSGINDSKFYFGDCFSTDNTTFSTESMGVTNIVIGAAPPTIFPSNYILFQELFNNKWVLYNSEIVIAFKTNDNYASVIKQYIFYKISDQ